MALLKLVVLVIFWGMTFYSDANSSEACSHLVGRWDGFFTIKDSKICQIFDGCTHPINVQVTYPPTDLVTPVFYEALVNPAAGIGGAFEIACEQGVIRCADCPNGLISVSCDKTHSCEMRYEGPLLLSKMTKIS